MEFKKIIDQILAPVVAVAVPALCHYIAVFSATLPFSLYAYGQNLSYPLIHAVSGVLFIIIGALLHFQGIGAGMILGGAVAALLSSFDFFLFIHDYSEVTLLVPALPRMIFFGAGLAALIFAAYYAQRETLKIWAVRLGIMVLLPFALYAAITVFLALPPIAKPLKRLLYYYYRETFNLLMVFCGVLLIIIGSHIKNRAVHMGIVLGALFCLMFPLIEIIVGRFH